jgi:hypothetical protein
LLFFDEEKDKCSFTYGKSYDTGTIKEIFGGNCLFWRELSVLAGIVCYGGNCPFWRIFHSLQKLKAYYVLSVFQIIKLNNDH